MFFDCSSWSRPDYTFRISCKAWIDIGERTSPATHEASCHLFPSRPWGRSLVQRCAKMIKGTPSSLAGQILTKWIQAVQNALFAWLALEIIFTFPASSNSVSAELWHGRPPNLLHLVGQSCATEMSWTTLGNEGSWGTLKLKAAPQ